jgi:hypothetical protein
MVRNAAGWWWGFLAAAMLAGPAQATVFTVTNTADSGPGSLRQAILDANAQQTTGGSICAGHTIVFAIPGAGPHTIRPITPLPGFAISINLNGFTQPGAVPNSLLLGNNAVMKIELDGSLAGAADGLTVLPGIGIPGVPSLCGGNLSTIRGMVINRFQGVGVRIGVPSCPANAICSAGGITLTGNFIGTDVTGNIALGNGTGGVFPAILLDSYTRFTVIGDQNPSDGGPTTPQAGNRNIIAASTGDGVRIVSPLANSVAERNVIRGNYIGLAASGEAVLPNGGHGVSTGIGVVDTLIQENLISGNLGDGIRLLEHLGQASLIGNGVGIGIGTAPFGNGGHGVHVLGASRPVSLARGALLGLQGGPAIAHNGGAGVFIADTAVVDFASVPVAENGGLGIDIAPVGVAPIDPLDGDTGPNEALNAPIVDAAFPGPANIARIVGRYLGQPGVRHEIYFYASPDCDPSGSGEGAKPVFNGLIPVFVAVTPDAAGIANFEANGVAQPGQWITAIARRFSGLPGQTALEVSEFSECTFLPTDAIFADGFEP